MKEMVHSLKTGTKIIKSASSQLPGKNPAGRLLHHPQPLGIVTYKTLSAAQIHWTLYLPLGQIFHSRTAAIRDTSNYLLEEQVSDWSHS